ncbi:PREDICTED: mitogen-activated protein kinase kinase kinase YODA-like [Camelina sativa]|uniref:Mitogen-activated protein kinase kinase kinase YODA-like n=1 Tax=Camelina sativa TaxID=90675 RepID=A0ABM0SLJ3_CAMSA|nr:PREDICTED: mitogen-activated protein kinase kinase kinase YODA-like [Camelina sativa]
MTPKTEFVKFLGKGSCGSVNLVKYIKSDDDSSLPLYAAVKTAECEEYDTLEREIQVLSKLKGCRSIVQCYGNYTLEEDFDVDGFRVYRMVMEYASAGSLATFIDSYKDSRLSDTLIRDFTRMILQGLVSVHSHGYVHCDLKPDNLLIFPCRESYELEISDFGSSRKVGEKSDCWEVDNPFMGTPIYMSPESVRDNVAEKALDLWSLGCIVLEMYTGVYPWSEINYEDLAAVLLHGEAPEIPESLPCDARKFIETCLARNPKERGSASDLLLHQFLRGEQRMEDTIYDSSLPISKKAIKLKIIPPKPPQFKHLKVKIMPPKPPAFSFIPVQ